MSRSLIPNGAEEFQNLERIYSAKDQQGDSGEYCTCSHEFDTPGLSPRAGTGGGGLVLPRAVARGNTMVIPSRNRLYVWCECWSIG